MFLKRYDDTLKDRANNLILFFEININKTVLFIVILHWSNIVQVKTCLTSLLNTFIKNNIVVVNSIYEFASLLNRFSR